MFIWTDLCSDQRVQSCLPCQGVCVQFATVPFSHENFHPKHESCQLCEKQCKGNWNKSLVKEEQHVEWYERHSLVWFHFLPIHESVAGNYSSTNIINGKCYLSRSIFKMLTIIKKLLLSYSENIKVQTCSIKLVLSDAKAASLRPSNRSEHLWTHPWKTSWKNCTRQ